jgi:hypothetical protein
MADNGSASGTPEINVGSFPTSIFLEVHSQNNAQTAAATGVPGGTAGPASGLNQLGPGDFSGSSAQAYGTVSSGAAVTPIFVNFQGSLPNVMFKVKNPG